MTTPVMSDLIYIQMVANADTAPGDVQWDQKIIGIPQSYMAGLGSGPANPGKLMGINGYPQTGGVTGTQFVMTGVLDDITKQAINDIPLPKVWSDLTARATYRTVARQLVRDDAVPASVVRTILKQLYDAAVLNDRVVP